MQYTEKHKGHTLTLLEQQEQVLLLISVQLPQHGISVKVGEHIPLHLDKVVLDIN